MTAGRESGTGAGAGAIEGDAESLELVVSLHRLLRGLRRAGPAGALQPTQIVTLFLLAEYGPARIGQIAERVPCSQPTATAAIAGLVTSELVRREPDPSDGRACRVVLTPRGRVALRDVAHGEAAVLARRLAALPEDQHRAVAGLAPVLRALADAPDRPDRPD
ncbi:MarR family winged helix-turn-helix transcriptional regulator [Streptomyces tsukubensis]|uniref:MarR family transcriptional regulator n=1 Tax=Streptomyces tsukubensis TaxID=83656 RepID=A0A1V4AFS4_9ACTN|nr:MarR family transcriptional regulator [Streptomyces tsukubensis]OON82537.1 MarR family transcriptional regulator [Streptomyces tsukubensis]QFR92299.1 MarR family transcriptional regulator [Streptomyces tsukubensis]